MKKMPSMIGRRKSQIVFAESLMYAWKLITTTLAHTKGVLVFMVA